MSKPVLIVDSRPLITFSRIGQLALLPNLGSQIVIPPAVWHKVTAIDYNSHLYCRGGVG